MVINFISIRTLSKKVEDKLKDGQGPFMHYIHELGQTQGNTLKVVPVQS